VVGGHGPDVRTRPPGRIARRRPRPADGVKEQFELDALPSPDELEELAQPWRPYRSMATWYFLAQSWERAAIGSNVTNSVYEVDGQPVFRAKAESLGGKNLIPPVDILQGSFAWFADPDGNTIALWKPRA